MIDWPRLLVIVMLTTVAILYGYHGILTIKDARGGRWPEVIKARFALCASTVLWTLGGVSAFIDFWGEPVSVRVPFFALAALLALYGYLFMQRFKIKEGETVYDLSR